MRLATRPAMIPSIKNFLGTSYILSVKFSSQYQKSTVENFYPHCLFSKENPFLILWFAFPLKNVQKLLYKVISKIPKARAWRHCWLVNRSKIFKASSRLRTYLSEVTYTFFKGQLCLFESLKYQQFLCLLCSA